MLERKLLDQDEHFTGHLGYRLKGDTIETDAERVIDRMALTNRKQLSREVITIIPKTFLQQRLLYQQTRRTQPEFR